MRPIDADELKALIKIEWDMAQGEGKHEQSLRGGIRKALRCMEETPTFDYAPKWISVKDRMPEIGQAVLAFDLIEKISVFTFDKDSLYGKCWTDDYGKAINLGWVTHWMALPEPPKEE